MVLQAKIFRVFVSYADGREKASLIPILDHISKLVNDWEIGSSANTKLALTAGQQAKQATLICQSFPKGGSSITIKIRLTPVTIGPFNFS